MKFNLILKSKIISCLMAMVLFQMGGVFSDFTGNLAFGKVFSHGPREQKIIALTFDDGPNNSSLPKILDLLKEHGIKASFFFTGESIHGHEEETKRTATEGHLVLNHSYTHPNFENSDEIFMNTELSATNRLIKNIVGVTPTIYRPPYGVLTPLEKNVVGRFGMNLALWDVDTRDWSSEQSLENLLLTVKNETHSGSIVLMHTQPNKFKSYEALEILIPYFKEEGYEFVKLDELLGVHAYEEVGEVEMKN